MFGAASVSSDDSDGGAVTLSPAKGGKGGNNKSALRQPLLSDVGAHDSDEAPAGDPVTVPPITDELGNQAPELAYRDLDRDTVYCSPLREFFKAIWRAFLIAIGR